MAAFSSAAPSATPIARTAVAARRARSSIPGSVTSGRRCSRSRTARSSTGVAFGAPVASGGDLVVNTSQTGYQEVCTDPSFRGQIVCRGPTR